MDENFKKIIELEEDSNAIIEFFNQSQKKVGDIEIVLSLVITKFLLNAKANFKEDGISDEKLELAMNDYKNRLWGLFEKTYMLMGKFYE